MEAITFAVTVTACAGCESRRIDCAKSQPPADQVGQVAKPGWLPCQSRPSMPVDGVPAPAQLSPHMRLSLATMHHTKHHVLAAASATNADILLFLPLLLLYSSAYTQSIHTRFQSSKWSTQFDISAFVHPLSNPSQCARS